MSQIEEDTHYKEFFDSTVSLGTLRSTKFFELLAIIEIKHIFFIIHLSQSYKILYPQTVDKMCPGHTLQLKLRFFFFDSTASLITFFDLEGVTPKNAIKENCYPYSFLNICQTKKEF